MSDIASVDKRPARSRPFGRSASLGFIAPAGLGLLLLATAGGSIAAPPVELSGELDVIIKEDFERGHFENDYFIRHDNGRDWYQLEFERAPPGHLRSGQRIRVRGESKGRRLQVDRLEEEGSAMPMPESLAGQDAQQLVDERGALVLMVDLTNAKASSRYSLAQIAGHMFTNTRSVDGLYREASLGRTGFPADTDGDGLPDVFGPFAINYSNSTCDYYAWAYAAEAAAQNAGINLSLYRHRVFVLPRYNDLPACSWAGIANVGCGTFCRSWIAEGESGMVYAHELGHNLNMAHAGTDPENDSVVNNVYGDSSDPMGSSRAWHVFNAGHIDQMGWYAGLSGAIGTVVASGIYHLAAIGRDPALTTAPTMLKIAKPDTNDFYYLSYRQPTGYDATLSSTYTKGVNVHRYRGSGYAYTTHITTLINGGIFTDNANGITVEQVASADGYATVEVSFGCAAATPTVALSPSALTLKTGATGSLSVAVTNRDAAGCAVTRFSLETSGSGAEWLAPISLMLAPGETGTATLEIGGTLAEGNYTITVSVLDQDGQAPDHTTGQGSASLMVDGTAPSVPAGLAGKSDNKGAITLTWDAATDALSGVAGYDVYRGGETIGQTSGTSFKDTRTVGGTTYQYSVTARDVVGNVSGFSNVASVTASGKTTGKPPK